MQKTCWAGSFHILHGRDVILTLMNGTDDQRELVQEALDRWWGPRMQFHGAPGRAGGRAARRPACVGRRPRMPLRGTRSAADDDPMVVWRIKSQGNDEARQQFLDGYVPQIWGSGRHGPDPGRPRGGAPAARP